MPSGARIPNVNITARNLDGANQESATSNSTGEYQFSSIPPGHYAVEYAAPGFALFKTQLDLSTRGIASRSDARLALGHAVETVVIHGQRPAAAGVLGGTVGTQVRVGMMLPVE